MIDRLNNIKCPPPHTLFPVIMTTHIWLDLSTVEITIYLQHWLMSCDPYSHAFDFKQN